MPQPECPQAQQVQLSGIAEPFVGAQPSLSPLQHQMFHAQPLQSQRYRRYNMNNDEMIAGKGPAPSTCNASRERLEAWLLQWTYYFTMIGIRTERAKLLLVGLCVKGKAPHWWTPKVDKYTCWSEVQTGIQSYYGDNSSANRAHVSIHELTQSGSEQDSLNEIYRLNRDVKILEAAIIMIDINKLYCPLRCSVAD